MNVKVKKVFKFISIVVISVLLLCSVSANIGLSISTRHFRELSERYRAELSAAVATNTELGKQLAASRRILEDCRRTTTELGESVNRNITTARGAIELVREIREKVILLESRFSDSNDNLNDNYSSTPNNEVK